MELRGIGLAVAIGLLGLVTGGEAQVPLSSACQTFRGVCPAPPAPVGAPCVCAGIDPGRMIYIAPGPPPMAQQPQQRLSTACGTAFGVCQTPYPAPVGSPCTCFGPRGPDSGNMIGIR